MNYNELEGKKAEMNLKLVTLIKAGDILLIPSLLIKAMDIAFEVGRKK